MKALAVVLGALAVITLLWIAGEQHRENCIREGRVACSVLPWENGKPAPKEPKSPEKPKDYFDDVK